MELFSPTFQHSPTLSSLSILTSQRTFRLELRGFSHVSDHLPEAGQGTFLWWLVIKPFLPRPLECFPLHPLKGEGTERGSFTHLSTPPPLLRPQEGAGAADESINLLWRLSEPFEFLKHGACQPAVGSQNFSPPAVENVGIHPRPCPPGLASLGHSERSTETATAMRARAWQLQTQVEDGPPAPQPWPGECCHTHCHLEAHRAPGTMPTQ